MKLILCREGGIEVMRLEEYRLKKGLSRNQLAEKIGTTRVTVFRWEKGINEPDYATLLALASILNCTVDDLIGNPTPAPEPVLQESGASGNS